MSTKQAELTFSINAGALARGEIKRFIIQGLIVNGLTDYDIQEEKGFLESLYVFKVRGPANLLQAFYDRLNQVLEQLNDSH